MESEWISKTEHDDKVKRAYADGFVACYTIVINKQEEILEQLKESLGDKLDEVTNNIKPPPNCS